MFDVPHAPRRHAATVLAAGLALVLGGACGGGDGGGDSGGDGPDAGASAVDAAAEDDAGSAVDGPYAVGRRTLTLVDPSRTTDAVPDRVPARPDRTIAVDVVYPAEGDAAPAPAGEILAAGLSVTDAAPADGRFPLVVFAHGYNGRGDTALGFAERWAREGYVVALPTFPLSQAGIAVSTDLANQPGDVSFVIDELAGPEPADDGLAGVIDPEHVAVGGHSLGAATVFGVAYNSCCLDERIDATITVAGGNVPFDGGTYDDAPPTPMLLVHGARDETVPIVAGDAVFELIDAPMWYLRPTGADHISVFAGEPGRLFNDAAIAFLDMHLRGGDPEALAALGDDISAGGIADWQVKA